MRIAAIDIGTNSLHMIVVRVRPDLSFEVIDREKDMVRLGAGGLDGRALTPEATQAALQVMSKFRRLADSHGVDEIIAVATSATREAENGAEFLKAIVEKTGIRPHVISGTEEARLIHRAAAYGVGSAGDTVVVVDIGGGSVEITRGTGPNMDVGRSFKLGVIRLTERFIKSDPLVPRDERKLNRYLDAELGKYLDQIRRAGFDRVVGTSGTVLSLGAVAHAERNQPAGASLRNRRISAKQLRRTKKDARRTRPPGTAPRAGPRTAPRRPGRCRRHSARCDSEASGRRGDHALRSVVARRPGARLRRRHRKEIVQADRYPDVRRRSVFELAERCNYWPEHAQQVARLSVAPVRPDARDPRPDRSRA